jgi:hypothetical protein
MRIQCKNFIPYCGAERVAQRNCLIEGAEHAKIAIARRLKEYLGMSLFLTSAVGFLGEFGSRTGRGFLRREIAEPAA